MRVALNEGSTYNSLAADKPVALKFRIEVEFRNVGFWGKGNSGVLREKTSRSKERTNNKLNPHMTPGRGIEPRPHW